ncbi:hypothetical protein EK904_002419, partial [Melospiza melodia maxima]
VPEVKLSVLSWGRGDNLLEADVVLLLLEGEQSKQSSLTLAPAKPSGFVTPVDYSVRPRALGTCCTASFSNSRMTLGISVIVPRGRVTAMTLDSGYGGCVVLLWGGFGVYFQQHQSLERNSICLQFQEKDFLRGSTEGDVLFFENNWSHRQEAATPHRTREPLPGYPSMLLN